MSEIRKVVPGLPPARLLANDSNTTKRPFRLIAGLRLWPSADTLLAFVLIRRVTRRARSNTNTSVMPLGSPPLSRLSAAEWNAT